jgi:ribonuclease VapC
VSAACVLDASAILALLHDEPGGDAVVALLPASVISSVNWAEVLQKSNRYGIDTEGMSGDLRALGVEIPAYDVEDAEATADLWAAGAQHLSLGDRACLALARRRGLVAVTADRGWQGLDIGIEIQTIR